MASRRPLAWISGALAELPVGDTVAGHAWYFGSGEPNAAAGAPGEYYVEANNRLWVKGSSAWTYTGVQLGSAANVAGKVVLVDADVISIGDSANSLQMRQFKISDFKTQFLSATLADAAASADLPAAGAALSWQSIVQTLRNGLKWVTSRFNGSGQLAVAFGGTGTNDLSNLPISAATAAALAQKVDKAYRTTPIGSQNTAESATWRSIGVIALAGSDSAKITLLGTGGYGDYDACSGETVIHIRGTNDTAGRGLEGHFFGFSQGNGTISGVCVVRLDGNRWRVYVRASQYMAISGVCDTSTSFAPENIDTGSGSQPENSRLLPSLHNLMIDGGRALTVQPDAAYLWGRGLKIERDYTVMLGPNSVWGAKLSLGGDPRFVEAGVTATAAVTNGNFHIDPAAGDYRIYCGFYRGKGVIFGSGGQQRTAEIGEDGSWMGAHVRPTSDNAFEVGGENLRYSTIRLASNPIVTSDARAKFDQRPSLGLDFILALRPVSYRIADAKVKVETESDGYDEVQEPLYETRQVADVEIVVIDGKPVQRAIEREERAPVVDLLPVTDEAGAPVLDPHGDPVMHPVQRMHIVRRPKTRQVRKVSEGVRRHHGLLAQEVLDVLESIGLTGVDFAGLIRDETSDTWGLRYEQFVAPLISAVQAQAKQISQLQEQVERLLQAGAAKP